MNTDLDPTKLSNAEKDARILQLSGLLQAALKRIAELEKRLAQLEQPPKTPDNSSMPPSDGPKANVADKPKRNGPRAGSLGRKSLPPRRRGVAGETSAPIPTRRWSPARRAANIVNRRSPRRIRS